MNTLIKNACIVLPDHLLRDGWLVIQDGTINDYGSSAFPKAVFDLVIDGNGLYLSPGFIDSHVHGAMGCSFIDGNPEGILTAMRFHLQHGTTSIFPTLTSATHAKYLKALEAFEALIDRFGTMEDIPDFEGIHMEGPYCSGKALGAQDTSTYRNVDYNEVETYLDMAPFIRKWTAAPEMEGGYEFGSYLERKGIVASIGHSDATLEQVFHAFDSGYHSITHLYSACSSYHRNGAYREGGIVEAAWLIDGMQVEMITDGIHLPKDFLRLIYKIKGPEHVSMITDAVRWAGVDDPVTFRKSHVLGNEPEVIIDQGVAFVPDRRCFAGSLATTDRLVRVATKIAGIKMEDAVRMASLTPAEVTHIDGKVGSIARGKRANLLLFDDDVSVKHIFLRGKMVQ